MSQQKIISCSCYYHCTLCMSGGINKYSMLKRNMHVLIQDKVPQKERISSCTCLSISFRSIRRKRIYFKGNVVPEVHPGPMHISHMNSTHVAQLLLLFLYVEYQLDHLAHHSVSFCPPCLHHSLTLPTEDQTKYLADIYAANKII